MFVFCYKTLYAFRQMAHAYINYGVTFFTQMISTLSNFIRISCFRRV